ncbi:MULTISPECIES: hypothetical protein [Halorhodospira]|uniref:hypothetical protein n=1 Tax=Halorhodospira TaxID=85108 RepID=UPI001EE9251B|nr:MULTISPECIES: hypothetical protein [Halorhodospira]MCG5526867.1 hypothetical protein [Halorhodospira halophila]MCG5542796.1 hypothetical protein [Halorhodospira sp. 9628]
MIEDIRQHNRKALSALIEDPVLAELQAAFDGRMTYAEQDGHEVGTRVEVREVGGTAGGAARVATYREQVIGPCAAPLREQAVQILHAPTREQRRKALERFRSIYGEPAAAALERSVREGWQGRKGR